MNTVLDCGKRLELSKIMGAPKQPALWLAAGKAVHAVTERWERAMLARRPRFNLAREWELAWQESLLEFTAVEPDMTKWRSNQAEPPEVWQRIGPEHCAAYFRWRQRSPQWRLWVTPDGEPAVELDVSTALPGCDLEVAAYADRVFEDINTGSLTVVDLKTGTRKPENGLQFGTYAACIEQKWGRRPGLGAAFMTRRGVLGDTWPLEIYTPEYMGRLFGKLAGIVKSASYIPHPSPACDRLCDVLTSCYIKGGPLAHLYDPDYPGFTPPF
jgi:putative RecB family exonuclease